MSLNRREEMKFSKVLARYYHKWYRDAHDSVKYCLVTGDSELRAGDYLDSANKYFQIIIDNWDAIEFFSVGDRAFLKDSALPEEFRGYE